MKLNFYQASRRAKVPMWQVQQWVYRGWLNCHSPSFGVYEIDEIELILVRNKILGKRRYCSECSRWNYE